MEFTDLNIQKIIAEKDLKKGESIWPTCVVKFLDGRKEALAFPFHNDGEKEYNLLKLRRYIQRTQVTSYMLVMEVWVSTNTEMSPGDSESRQEEVLFVVHNGTTEKHFSWPISRNEDGTGFLTEPRNQDIENVIGGFANLFDTSIFDALSSSQKRRLDKVVSKMLKKSFH